MRSKIVSELRRVLLPLSGLDFILRVGLARKVGHDERKVDLLVGCDAGGIQTHSSEIQNLLKGRWPKAKLSISDDSVRFDLKTSSGGIAICDSTKLVAQIKEWINGRNLNGQHRSWAIGYWLPEALCGDLATAEVLHDAKSIYAEIRKLVIPYPESLSQAIVVLCADEVRQKLSVLNRLVEENRAIELALCLSDIGSAAVRLAFARSRHYLRGFRSIAEQAAFLRPSDFALYELASNLFQEKEVGHTLDEIRDQF